jgi:hypothetical protein
MRDVKSQGWDDDQTSANEVGDHEDCEETVAGGRDSRIHE